jgi:hypothetical protein
MKIYIWDGALADYYGGLIVVVAPSLKAAKDAARKKIDPSGRSLATSGLSQDLKSKPQVVRITDTMRPRVWYSHGGG